MEVHHYAEEIEYCVRQDHQGHHHNEDQTVLVVPSLVPVQVFIHFVYKVKHQYAISSYNTHIMTPIGYPSDHQEKQLDIQFDLWMVDNSMIVYQYLSRQLFCLGVDPSLHSPIVDQVFLTCKTTGHRDYCNVGGLTFLPLEVSITKVQFLIHCEWCLADRFFQEWMEAEASDDEMVMVAASESSIEELLIKRVRVCGDEIDESEICSVCLEELGAACYAACMPCSHVYHADCIATWLRKSHYCPLCRFEMPTHDPDSLSSLNSC